MKESSSTVFLVDDDLSVRVALARLIKSRGFHVETFASAGEFLNSDWYKAQVACLVLDVRLPDLSGLDLQRDLQTEGIALPIVFITGHGDIPMGIKAMKNGAVDFLPKPVEEDELVSAIERALAKADHERAEQLELQDIQRRLETLTPREREVMTWVVSGLLNKQIAFELGTVEKTVKVHRARVMEKMEVSSFAELVRIAERVGIGKK
ncbi:MAG TPA: response regulator transcription factor [Candidatus Binatia bacterium]|jgi:FixJ family two-component response regulator